MLQAPPQLEKSWQVALEDEWTKPYMKELASFVAQERASGTPIYPSKQDVFKAFEKTPFDQVKVVIVGQDPYHGPGQAEGLCFSVKKGIPQPPSLQNIFKELKADLGIEPPGHGSLVSWTKQGVLLLNTVLTVREGQPHSHSGKGWELFTDSVIALLAKRHDPLIFVLWGKAAQEKCHFLAKLPHHHIILSPHPSPFSAHSGFFGSRPFSKINNLLKQMGKEPIDWRTSNE